jgi:hypothetical protein
MCGRDMLWTTKLDVVFLQEVKFVGFELRRRISYCCRGPYWALEHSHGSGGVILAYFSFLQSYVVGHGVDLLDKCVWVTILI